jgi:small subunit ribosomal protein S16
VAVKIRLKRLGKVKVPQYRIVVVDSRKKRDGRVIEEIGKYHPKEDPSYIDVVSDRAQYWLGVGAQPSDAVAAILKITGDWQKFRGEPGAEGTLKTAEPKRDKIDVFNEALKDAAKEPKGAAVTKKSAKKADKDEAAAEEPKAEEPRAEEPKAEEPKAEEPKAEEPKAEEPRAEEPKAEEPKAEEPKAEEPKAEVPASETPEGAAEQAEATEEVTAEDAGKSEA